MSETTVTKRESETPEGTERTSTRPVFQPQVDIRETGDAIWLVADMPGVDEHSTEVMLEKNVLTIRGTVAPQQPDGYSLVWAEYQVGDYERSFTVSNEIDRDGIEALVRNGVVRIKLPKSKRAAMQKIAVRGGE